MLAGLCARAASGGGQYVTTSLLGAGLLLHSVVFERDGEVVSGPGLDAAQTGYGPGYRLYAGADGRWLALVLPDEAVWRRLTSLPELASLPAEYAPLRGFLDGALDAAARQAETVLEEAFATAPSSTTRSTASSAASSPSRPPTGAGSSRSARSCAAVPRISPGLA
jgi:crotonobetainyl-CoA:carnitine CoA-transferase CaiB-like acyl-CoA transferase